jgi:hypothetical protein
MRRSIRQVFKGAGITCLAALPSRILFSFWFFGCLVSLSALSLCLVHGTSKTDQLGQANKIVATSNEFGRIPLPSASSA